MSDKIIGPLAEAWLAANDCSSDAFWRAWNRLIPALREAGYKDLVNRHFQHWDHFAKWQLLVVSILVGYDHKQIDDGVWRNRKGGAAMPKDEVDEEIRQAHCVAALYTSQQE